MKCYVCGAEMRNTVGGCYRCDNCGFGIDDLVYRQQKPIHFYDGGMPTQPLYEPEKHCYQQGWVCPKCGGVYSPSQGCCPNCTPAQPIKFTCDTGTAGKPHALDNYIITARTAFTSSDLYPQTNFDVKYSGVTKPKRGRGRPRIHPVKPKRPVGRPRKVVKD